jgi:hypothetical protein
MWAAAFLFALAALASLGTATVAAFFLFRGKSRIARRLFGALAAAGALYAAAIVGVALTSEQTIIALGGEKHICEIDCHIAYSVVAVEQAAALNGGAVTPSGDGEFYIVTVRTRFDASTISEQRSREAPLMPGPRAIALVDAEGHRYGLSPAGQAALEEPAPSPTLLSRSLKPGESFTTNLVFEVPRGIRDPLLLIEDTDFTKWVLIGSESFPLHKKALFRLHAGPGVRNVAS